jgi:hypothetical protein
MKKILKAAALVLAVAFFAAVAVFFAPTKACEFGPCMKYQTK